MSICALNIWNLSACVSPIRFDFTIVVNNGVQHSLDTQSRNRCIIPPFTSLRDHRWEGGWQEGGGGYNGADPQEIRPGRGGGGWWSCIKKGTLTSSWAIDPDVPPLFTTLNPSSCEKKRQRLGVHVLGSHRCCSKAAEHNKYDLTSPY